MFRLMALGLTCAFGTYFTATHVRNYTAGTAAPAAPARPRSPTRLAGAGSDCDPPPEVMLHQGAQQLSQEILSRLPFGDRPALEAFTARNLRPLVRSLQAISRELASDYRVAKRCFEASGLAERLTVLIGWQAKSTAERIELAQPEFLGAVGTVPPATLKIAQDCAASLLKKSFTIATPAAASSEDGFVEYNGLVPLPLDLPH